MSNEIFEDEDDDDNTCVPAKWYDVAVVRDPDTGHRIIEAWHRRGVGAHRDGDLPAYSQFRASDGKLELERYYLEGKLHRSPGPAEIEYDPDTGKVIREAWFENGIERRAGAPAQFIHARPAPP